MSTQDRIEVCPTSELEPGDRKIVNVDRVSIGVFNIDGEYFGVANTCRHQQAPLCEGEVSPIIRAETQGLGEHVEEYYDDEHMVVCPWHNWAYSLETGNHIGDEEISVPTYDIVEEEDTLYIEL